MTSSSWRDQGAGGHDIIFANSPTIVSGATPLRDAVRFNGTNQNGVVATPAINQPFTIYLVANSVSWTNGENLLNDGVTNNVKRILQSGASPAMTWSAGNGRSFLNPLAVGTWGVMSVVANGLTSVTRVNKDTRNAGDGGSNDGAGVTLGSSQAGAVHANCEIGYLIIRTGTDSNAINDYILDQLEKICGLTF